MATAPEGTEERVLDLDIERSMLARGHTIVAGVDEVGRGAWAGPMFVGVVAVDASTGEVPPGTRDSKALSAATRRELRPLLASWCASWAIGRVSAREIDELGLTEALRVATRRGLAALPLRPSCVIVDGPYDFISPPEDRNRRRRRRKGAVEVHPLVGADDTCPSVAAASVLAKVARDELMMRLARRLPGYGFDQHKGYGTVSHAAAIEAHGLSREHRRSWVFADRLAPYGVEA